MSQKGSVTLEWKNVAEEQLIY